MEPKDAIQEAVDFFDKEYDAELTEHKRQGKARLTVDFKKLAQYNPELAEELLDNPEDTLAVLEQAIKDRYEVDEFKVRIKNNSPSIQFRIRDIRSNMLNKFLSFEGIIESKSDVRPQVVSAKFECPNCGNAISVIQDAHNFKEPTKCGCGRKGKFNLLTKETMDAFVISIQELPETIKFDPELKSLKVFLSKDLAESKIEERLFQGTRIKVTGILKEVPIITRTGATSTKLDYLLDANYVDITENNFFDFKISKAEMNKIEKIAKDDNAVNLLANIVYKKIYGYDLTKEGLLLQQFGGVTNHKTVPIKRGEIHIAMIGDPGEGKSDLIEIQMQHSLKANFANAVTASDVGLAGAVEQDKITGGWSFKAGPLILANKGICCIDEFNELEDRQKNIMREPMQSSRVTINKASVKRNFMTKTSFLISANPKYDYFDKYASIYEQFNIPPAVLSRFDLIFVFRSSHDRAFEKKKAELILGRGYNIEMDSIDFFKKYLSLAKKIDPQMPSEVKDYISERYADMKSKIGKQSEGKKQFPISPRYVNTIARLSEAKARIHLRKLVRVSDVEYVLDLIYHTLKDSQADPDTGEIDMQYIETGKSSSERTLGMTIMNAVHELSQKDKVFLESDLIETVLAKGNFDLTKIEEVLNKLKKKGELIEPRRSYLMEA